MVVSTVFELSLAERSLQEQPVVRGSVAALVEEE